MVEITIKPDQTLGYKWTGSKRQGSMFKLAAESNCKKLNRLPFSWLVAVRYAAQSGPYALNGKEHFLACLEHARKKEAELSAKIPLGQLRHALLMTIGESNGAPLDTYLDIAYDLAEAESATENTP